MFRQGTELRREIGTRGVNLSHLHRDRLLSSYGEKEK